MSTERDKDNHVIFHCDHCGEAFDSETGNFQTSFTLVIAEGWSYDKQKREHNCGCLDELAQIPSNDIYGDYR